MNTTRLSIVVPCYNEQEVLEDSCAKLLALLKKLMAKGLITPGSELLLVDDGSTDSTWSLIEQIAQQETLVTGISLSRNRGHQNALLAGLSEAKGEAIITIDADLQDDISVIEQMVQRHQQGFEIVYGVRQQRNSDTQYKRITAQWYYRLLLLMGVEIIADHADFRLLGRQALSALQQYQEVNLFLRGIIPTLGYPTCQIYYDRKQRQAGTTKYSMTKMLALAIDGITSFSAIPLRFIAVCGLMVFIISLLTSMWAMGVRLFSDDIVPGWASSVLPMYLLGGVQLLSIGVVGEYVAKIYLETKNRPRFFIEKSTKTKTPE